MASGKQQSQDEPNWRQSNSQRQHLNLNQSKPGKLTKPKTTTTPTRARRSFAAYPAANGEEKSKPKPKPEASGRRAERVESANLFAVNQTSATERGENSRPPAYDDAHEKCLLERMSINQARDHDHHYEVDQAQEQDDDHEGWARRASNEMNATRLAAARTSDNQPVAHNDKRAGRHLHKPQLAAMGRPSAEAAATSTGQRHCQTISSTMKQPKLTRGGGRRRNNKSDCAAAVVSLSPRAGGIAGGCGGIKSLVMAMVAVCLAGACWSASLIGPCDCDSGATGGARPPHSAQRREADWTLDSSWASVGRQVDEQRIFKNHHAPAERRSSPTTTATNKQSNSSGHKDKLLSSLAESIERQHWGLGGKSNHPATSWGSSSKFDAGSSSAASQLNDILASHEAKPKRTQQVAARPSIGKSPSKAEQDLRQIMLMHEASAGALAHKHAQVPHQRPTGAGGAAAPSGHTKATRWLAASSASDKPLRLLAAAASSPMANSNVLSSVVSLLSPKKQSGQLDKLTLAGGDTKTGGNSTAGVNPFTPRANAKNYLMGPLLGLGQMLMQTGQPAKPSNPFYYKPDTPPPEQGIYSQPANSLLGSSFISKKTSSSQQHNNKQQKAKKLLSASAASGQSSSATDLVVEESSQQASLAEPGSTEKKPEKASSQGGGPLVSNWIKNSANHLAQNYFQDSFRDLLTLSQLPILSGGPVSTAPSDLEPGGKKWLADKTAAQQNKNNRTQTIEDILRYAYILGNVGVRRKRDPLKVLSSSPPTNTALALASHNTHKHSRWLPLKALSMLQSGSNKLPTRKLGTLLAPSRNIRPRGVMWDMATDPSLAVTVFHLLERASVALPLGFLLMPFVHMVRHPLNGINLGRILPARASHRSVDYEELVKRIDMMDKILSRAMRPTHRDSSFMG